MRLSYEPKDLRRVSQPADFGRVAVLFGGDSSEREISLLSGNAVLEALRSRAVDAHAFDPRDRSLPQLLEEGFARVWIALHGPGGEDGTLQGALEYLGVPYTGSGVMGSAIAMDKVMSKRIFDQVGVSSARWRIYGSPADAEAIGYPLVVKPSREGSSVGVTIVREPAALAGAVA